MAEQFSPSEDAPADWQIKAIKEGIIAVDKGKVVPFEVIKQEWGLE